MLQWAYCCYAYSITDKEEGEVEVKLKRKVKLIALCGSLFSCFLVCVVGFKLGERFVGSNVLHLMWNMIDSYSLKNSKEQQNNLTLTTVQRQIEYKISSIFLAKYFQQFLRSRKVPLNGYARNGCGTCFCPHTCSGMHCIRYNDA